LPLNGRNVTELVPGRHGEHRRQRLPELGPQLSDGDDLGCGRISNWTAYNFDGVAHNDAYNSLNLPLPFPDALQDSNRIQRSAAQYGVHASANVNVVTKVRHERPPRRCI